MPRLATKMAAAVEKSEAIQGGFEPLKPGKYLASLEDVEAREDRNQNSAWNVTFSNIRGLDGAEHPGKQFLWMGLPQPKPRNLNAAEAEKFDKAEKRRRGQLKAFFDAFGADTDTDTDDLLNQDVMLVIGTEIAKAGKNAGQTVNRVNGVYPVPDEDALDEFTKGGGDSDEDEDDDEF